MQKNDGSQNARYQRVVFVRNGKEESLTFLGTVPALNFLKTLHSSRKGKVVPVPELDNLYLEPTAADRPIGTIVLCPRGPRMRTWTIRRPRIQKRYPDFSRNVMELPKQSAGFSLTFPEQPSSTFTVVARHETLDAANAWSTVRFGKEADGEWWPKDEPKKNDPQAA